MEAVPPELGVCRAPGSRIFEALQKYTYRSYRFMGWSSRYALTEWDRSGVVTCGCLGARNSGATEMKPFLSRPASQVCPKRATPGSSIQAQKLFRDFIIGIERQLQLICYDNTYYNRGESSKETLIYRKLISNFRLKDSSSYTHNIYKFFKV